MTGVSPACPPALPAVPTPCPAYAAVHRGQIIHFGDTNTNLREKKSVSWGVERIWGTSRGQTRDTGGWGLTGWADRTGRTLSPLGKALVKPDGSVAPMVIFCRISVEKKWGGRAPVPSPVPKPTATYGVTWCNGAGDSLSPCV